MGNRTIEEILRLSRTERRSEYEAVNISKVLIDENEFANYGAYSFLWEKSYVKSPERSGDGSIGNLNSYATFVTGHLKIDFSVMSIDDYRRLMKLIYSKNEFVVKCYDVVYNTTATLKMYFSTEEMPKLWTIANMKQKGADDWEEWVDLVGVQGYTVEMIGTNNDIDLVSVMYYPNYPSSVTQKPSPDFQAEEDMYIGADFIVGASATYQNNPPNGYKFAYWASKVDEKGNPTNDSVRYDNGSVVTLDQQFISTGGLTLYAVWQTTNKSTLSYNFGISKPVYSGTLEEEKLYNKLVQYNESIGTLPRFEIPSVTINGETYGDIQSPYKNGGWYRLPVKDEAVRVRDNDLYNWTNRDSIIYLLFDKREYEVEYETYKVDIEIPIQIIEYGATITLPVLASSTQKFDGWYFDNTFTKKAGGTMPPYHIKLFAKWTNK